MSLFLWHRVSTLLRTIKGQGSGEPVAATRAGVSPRSSVLVKLDWISIASAMATNASKIAVLASLPRLAPHASVQRVTSPPMCGRPGSPAQPLGPGSPSDAWRRDRSRLPSRVGLAMAAWARSSARLLNDRLVSRVTFVGASAF